jgi:hypothetical protein
MAKDRLPQIPAIRITTASHVLAMLRARKAVKRQLQAQGLKVSAYSAADITRLAQQYLSEHRAQLIPAAIEQARAIIASGALGKRAQRALLKTNAQSAEPQSIGTSVVQNSGAKWRAD